VRSDVQWEFRAGADANELTHLILVLVDPAKALVFLHESRQTVRMPSGSWFIFQWATDLVLVHFLPAHSVVSLVFGDTILVVVATGVFAPAAFVSLQERPAVRSDEAAAKVHGRLLTWSWLMKHPP